MIDHLAIAPILLPLLAGGLMMIVAERRRTTKAVINLASTLGLVGIAIVLVRMSDTAGAVTAVYRLGDWPAPFAIVLVVDRLSALMLLLTGILALAALLFSLARWHREGAYFHALFQFLLMGLNGAFLTGDLFNLFVFFELLLVASYGLALHGSGSPRVRAGLHYIAINLAASLLFLIGVSLIYGVAGTLNMADLAARIPHVAAENRGLLEAGAAILGIAFLVKAGMWPLCFWLPTTYAAAPPPVAAVFAIMTKVGAYVVLRLFTLLFADGTGPSAEFGGVWLLFGGLATIAFGVIGTLASQDMARLAAFSVVVSSGTVLAAIGLGEVGVVGGALFYMVSSTLAIAAFFMLVELVQRGREPGADMLAVTRESYGEAEAEEEEEVVGIAIPATMGALGLAFVGCTAVIAGVPPLSGFIAKFALLTAVLNPSGMSADGSPVQPIAWVFVAILIVSGLTALIALVRAGIHAFWAVDRTVPRVRVIEMAPVAILLLLCAMQTVQAGPIMRYMQATAGALYLPRDYIGEVLGTDDPQAPPAGRQ
jgi:multicomponent K+:H+ antiporter subunit D